MQTTSLKVRLDHEMILILIHTLTSYTAICRVFFSCS